jgi:UDP-sugar pyrophosphorylase
VLGISSSKNLEMNSITIPRYPGEAIGAICELQSPFSKITINVEYNQIQSLFSGPEPTDSQGFSLFPGNTNCLVLSIPEYSSTLQETKGLIAEFINPKYQPNSTDFKSSARLECMMQDYPKLLKSSDRVGFTMI